MTEGAGPSEDGRRRLEAELAHLTARAVEMGTWALDMVHDGWEAFRTGDLGLAQKVLDRDTELDRLDQEVEHEVIGFLVVRQPAAGDLRSAAALLKSTTHLDRIGRLGFDMARMTRPPEGPRASAIDALLGPMDRAVEALVRRALTVLKEGDAEGAKGLFALDDEVDRMHGEAMRAIVGRLVDDPRAAPRLAGALLVARHFERIADNACKIGERTIYAATGQRRGEYLPRHAYVPYALEGLREG